jgi:geranylgeranyl diphosphate synthase, type II
MIKTYSRWIDLEIRKKKFGHQPESLYEPLRYIMSLGGKRLRPLLTLLAYHLYKDDVRTAVPSAVAVEVFHNFTLLHDDIMDNAPIRRGKITVHNKWNVSTAILAGDVMQIKVYDAWLGIKEGKLKAVLKAFNQCATEVCEGQQWDMEFERGSGVSEKEYLEMIRLKTGVLLGFSLELGAILGGAPKKDQLALRRFGTKIGIGFQLKDDLLDVYADSKKFGKQVGGDILANKKTFLFIKAWENAKGKVLRELNHWTSVKTFNKKKKIKSITAIYDQLNLRDLTEKKIAGFFDKGFQDLDRLAVSESGKAALRKFILNLIDRQS